MPLDLGFMTGIRVVVLTHEIDDFDRGQYLLKLLCQRWQAAGAEVRVVSGTCSAECPGDLAILHTDVTSVGDDYRRLIESYPIAVNGAVVDISKTVVSDLVVGREDAGEHAVIVKTNANFGGSREFLQAKLAGQPHLDARAKVPWDEAQWLLRYPIFESARDVPPGIWSNPRLVVEQFLPERYGEQFVLRVWVFLGDQSIHYRCISNQPVVKSHNTLRRELLDPDDIPEGLRQKRAQLGFDYGKFDYAMVDGRPVLYDANRTPGAPTNVTARDGSAERIDRLSAGLRPLLAGLAS